MEKNLKKCVCIYMCVYIYTCIYVCVYICIYIYTYMYISGSLCYTPETSTTL